MWWRFFVAISLLTIILLAGLWMLGYMNALFGQITACLDTAIDRLILTGDGADGASLHAALEIWQRGMPMLCAYVTHEQIDLTGEIFERALGLWQRQNWDEYLAALRELRFRIALIQHYDSPSLRSIF